MSNRTLLIALVVALALGAATLLVVRLQNATPRSLGVGERLISIAPTNIAALTLRMHGAQDLRIERDAEPGSWRLVEGASAPMGSGTTTRTDPMRATALGSAWPLDASRVQDVLRMLSEVRTTGRPAADAAQGADSLSLTIEPDATAGGAGPLEIDLSTRRLAGSVLASVRSVGGPGSPADKARLALVSDSLLNVLTAPGPREWRERGLLTWAVEASRVRLIGGGTSVALAKSAGVWSLSEPIESPADHAAVMKTLGTLQLVRVAKFHDEPAGSPASLGFESPTARIILERDVGGKAERRELTIGQAADAAGSTLYATTDGGATAFTVPADKLSQVATDPSRYVSGTVSRASAADIAALMFHASSPGGPSANKTDAAASLGVRRTLEGWMEIRPDGTQVLQDPARAGVIDRMLAFLTSVPASTASLDEPAGFAPLGSLSVMDARGNTLDEIVVARSAAPGVVVLSGRVYRGFAAMPQFLQIALGPIAPMPAQADAGSTEINK